jgi:hypothetical protein
VCVCVCDTGVWTHGYIFARQALSRLNHSISPGFRFLRTLHTDFHDGYTNLTAGYEVLPQSPHSNQFCSFFLMTDILTDFLLLDFLSPLALTFSSYPNFPPAPLVSPSIAETGSTPKLSGSLGLCHRSYTFWALFKCRWLQQLTLQARYFLASFPYCQCPLRCHQAKFCKKSA